MKPIFSLCVPTRNRVQFIERLLGTLKDTVDNGERIEILFAIDDDDIISEAYLRHCRKRSSFAIKVFKREQSKFFNRDYYNWLADKAVGEFVWVIGDDLLFIKKGWDTILINKINEYFLAHPARVVYINIKDNTPLPIDEYYPSLPNYSNFPLISKEAITAVGYFMPPQIPSWSGDYVAYLAYNSDRCNRVLNIEEPILEHICYLTTDNVKVNRESDKRMRAIHKKYKVGEYVPVWIKQTLPSVRQRVKNYVAQYRRDTNEPIKLF